MKRTNRKALSLLALAGLIAVLVPVSMAGEGDAEIAVKGEILDMACYIAKGAKGEGHAGCAKACVKGGQPMGLLTDDGTLVLLAADHKDGAPYEALKDLAGEKASVSGSVAERDGVKVVTVTGSKKAA